jgi:hypothetical protein
MSELSAPTIRPWTRPGPVRAAVLVMGSAGAAAIHFGMIPAHADESTVLAVGFAVCAWLQAAFAVAVLIRPTRGLLVAGAVLNVLALAVWGWSRLFGLPLGIGDGDIEPVVAIDALCAVLEAAVIVAAIWPAATRTSDHRRRSWAVVTAGVATVAVVGATSAVLAAPSSHDHAVAHQHADHAAAANAASSSAAQEHVHDHAAAAPTASDATGAGSTDAHTAHQEVACAGPVTDAERGAAAALVDETRATLERYTDLDAAVAAGFVTITPAGQKVVHYGNPAWIRDGRVLDPAAPEVLVYAFPPGFRPVLLGAMYLNEGAGTPPMPGGCLTRWHEHTNLCFAPGHGMVGIVAPDGSCPAGSFNRTTEAMMHVWRYDTSAGPFAELNAINPAELRAAVIPDLQRA